MKLSNNFTLEEMCFSETAIRRGILNVPDERDIENLTALVTLVLQPVRDHFGIVKVSSGFRNPELNKVIGGEKTSQHLRGQAADFTCPGYDNDAVWRFIKSRADIPWDQVILEHVPEKQRRLGWVHVSWAPTQRRSALSCVAAGDYRDGLHFAL